jgi:hypothetical protein
MSYVAQKLSSLSATFGKETFRAETVFGVAIQGGSCAAKTLLLTF